MTNDYHGEQVISNRVKKLSCCKNNIFVLQFYLEYLKINQSIKYNDIIINHDRYPSCFVHDVGCEKKLYCFIVVLL